MICFKCKKKIGKKDHYFSFIEFLEGKIVNTDYTHKECWDEVKNPLKVYNKAYKMLEQLKEKMKKEGIILEEEYIIP